MSLEMEFKRDGGLWSVIFLNIGKFGFGNSMQLVRQFIPLVPHMRESLKLLPALLYAPGKQIREDLGIVITVEERKKEKEKGRNRIFQCLWDWGTGLETSDPLGRCKMNKFKFSQYVKSCAPC